MNIFVLNCGSSSLKYRMISMPTELEILGGEVQRIASKTAESARIVHHESGRVEINPVKAMNHKEALAEILGLIRASDSFPPAIIAHRLVQGGTQFPVHKILTEDHYPLLDAIADLAPIHNPPVIELIKECKSMLPNVPQAIILDTAFHSTIPEYASAYAIPEEVRRELGIKKYGFHGISHEYVTEEASKFLHIPLTEFNAVSCHLGSGGASLCAIVKGKSVDNSMGFSPLQGLVMSTRCGDIDPALILRMLAYSTGDFTKVNQILNKKSGVLGLSGISSDIRDVIERASVANDDRAQETLDVYIWRIRKYLGAYLAVVGRPHALIFTDTIGESDPFIREAVCRGLDFFGVKMDEWKNNAISTYPSDISAADGRTRIIVVRTNEELAMARKTFALLTHHGTYRPPQNEREDSNEAVDCIRS